MQCRVEGVEVWSLGSTRSTAAVGVRVGVGVRMPPHLCAGSTVQHLLMKSRVAGATSRSKGGLCPLAMWYIAAMGLGNMGHGILAVSISTTVQPRLQTSAFFQP